MGRRNAKSFSPLINALEQEHACALDVQHTHAAPSRGKPLSPGALVVLLWCWRQTCWRRCAGVEQRPSRKLTALRSTDRVYPGH